MRIFTLTPNIPDYLMNLQLHIDRRLYLFIALACLLLLGFGYYLQFVQGLDPCPLCILQRAAYLAVGIVCLAGFFHGSATRIYAALALVLRAGGRRCCRQAGLAATPAAGTGA